MKKLLSIIGVLLVVFVLSACKDKTKPLIVLEGETAITITIGQEYVEPGYRVFDNDDTALEVIITTDLDNLTIGTYEVKYNVTDNSGNKADEVIRQVIVLNYLALPSLYKTAIDDTDIDGLNELFEYTNGIELINVFLINYAYTETKNLEVVKLLFDNYQGSEEVIVDITYYDGTGLKEIPLSLLFLFDINHMNSDVTQWFNSNLDNPESLTYIESTFGLLGVTNYIFEVRYEVTYLNDLGELEHKVFEFSFDTIDESLLSVSEWIKDELTNITHIWE